MENLTRRKIQAIESKKRIERIAMELFIDQGFDNVKIATICTKANISVGAFYHHYKSKEDIIFEFYSSAGEYFHNVVWSTYAHLSSIERLKKFLMDKLTYDENIGVDLLSKIYSLLMDQNKHFEKKDVLKTPEIIYQIIDEGVDTGAFRQDLSKEFLTNLILKLQRGAIYDWCSNNGSYSLAQTFAKELEAILPVIRFKNTL